MAEVTQRKPALFTAERFQANVGSTALAFRGYNVTNLGRSPELLEIPAYEPLLSTFLARGSRICSEIKGRHIDLRRRLVERRETSLATYDEAITLVIATEMAQLEILRQRFGIDLNKSQVAYGFSLGEIAAVVAGQVLDMEAALQIPLEMSDDCVALAKDVTLAVVFSRRGSLDEAAVSRLCQEVNEMGRGIVGVSAYLAPNSLLLIGQRDAMKLFSRKKATLSSERVYLRRNDHRWPPLHTPIVWERNIVERSQRLMHAMPTRMIRPNIPVFSLVTGTIGYDGSNTRSLFGKWIDCPQRLWDAVVFTLSVGVETVMHVGPEPNIIPATFDRLALNVANQTRDSVRMRALSGIVNRPWLSNLLPKRTALLRAPRVRHVILEDWLLANVPR